MKYDICPYHRWKTPSDQGLFSLRDRHAKMNLSTDNVEDFLLSTTLCFRSSIPGHNEIHGMFGSLLQEILQIPFSIIEDKNEYNMVNKVSFG